MGALQPIAGAKGGGKRPKPPTETPDSLVSIAYAKILDLISEGPIVGLVNGNQSIYLNQTPLENPDGSSNFEGVSVGTRTGEADQDYLPGFPSVESENPVGVELSFASPWVQTISNVQLSAVRVRLSVPYLTQTDDKGNIYGYEVKYAIDVATDAGAYVEVINTSFNGKTTSTYERSHRIDLPVSSTGWRLRVRRLTEDSTSSSIQSQTNVVSYTEIIDAKLRYPYAALVGLTVDAAQFSSIPSRAFDCKLRIIKVPSNYDVEQRSYIGVWDGTFKLEWTDNPAWIYYDLILNDRYGLGQLISAAQVDKWGLYQIARYCDEPVIDGKGGVEPRFTCNLYLQTRADALQVLQDLASIFRGMAYWAGGSVTAVADMPVDPVYTYNQANVIDGKFTYAGSARSTRFSVALVSWNDPANFYEKKVEYVSDQKALARYGVQQTEISAFGCTSQGQAQRLGHYTLLTNRLENETVGFSAGLDATIARPGQIIRIADAARAGRRIGGRVHHATATTVTLDADSNVSQGDSLTVILPSGIAETRTVSRYQDRVVKVASRWTKTPVAQSVFAIESAQLVAQTYRVISVAENFGEGELKYDITAVKHVAGKYAAIDHGAQIVQLPVTVTPPNVQVPAGNIRLSSFSAVDQGISRTTMRAEWDAPANAVSYDVWWRRNSSDWVYAGRSYTASIEVVGIYAGTYLVRVAALNPLNASSRWGYSDPTFLKGKEGLPAAVTSLSATSLIFGIALSWTFPPGAEDTQRTEIWYSPTPDLENGTKLSDLSYPQSDYSLQGLLAGATYFFWARLVDRTGNIGPWHPASLGVMGQASSEAGPILGMIAGQIGETTLGQQLADRIDLVDGPEKLAGSVNNRLQVVRGAINAVSERVDGVFAQINPEMAGTEQELAGSAVRLVGVWSEQSARIEEGVAIGKRVDHVQATVGETNAAVQQVSQAIVDLDGKASAMWSVKLQVNAQGQYVAAGIGLGIENTPAGLQSQFLVSADRFAVINGINNTLASPFAIQGGQVFINQSFIQDGTITNAKIGSFISSTNYIAGQQGWLLSKDGRLEINGVTPGGGRLTINNRAVKVFDQNGVLRVQLGDLSV